MPKKNNKIYILGLLLLLIGTGTFSYSYINEKIDVAYEMMNLKILDVSEEDEEKAEKVDTSEAEQAIEENTDDSVQEPVYDNYYIGELVIPKINLTRGFVDMDSPDNNVNVNIQIITPSDYPDVNTGNFILAAHSGNGRNAFFGQLYLLSKGDVVYINYQDIKYTYQIKSIYLQEKTGSITIYRDDSKTTLTLITCTKDDNTKQTVYIAELISKE